MQVSVESTGALERRMTVQVPADKVDEEVVNRLKRVGKTARLDGFRKGKIPFGVIKKRFGPQIHREVLGDLIQSSYHDALREQDLNPAGQPSIVPAEVAEGKDLEYTATFEIYPEVNVKTLEGLKIERPVCAVTDADVDKMIETLRQQRANWVPVDRQALTGDRITLDFVGTLNGEEFEGGKAEGYTVEIGSGQLLSDLENGMIGMKAEDERSIPVSFPDSYHAAELAGKTAEFAVTVTAVEEQSLPEVDAGFMEQFGLETDNIDEFRESVRDNMNREMEDRLHAKVRQVVLDALWDANTFELPNALVDQEIKYLQEDSLKRMGIEDMSQLPPPDAFADQARRRVGLGLLMNEVIKLREIAVDQELVDKKLTNIASSYASPDELIKSYRSNRQMMNQIEMMVLEEQVVGMLIDTADVTEKSVSFDELVSH
ncbi:MAG: trigger factor [Gammaproteobacteria bacterium]|nr:trigger factor [Gammaproteobacteria bacterium]